MPAAANTAISFTVNEYLNNNNYNTKRIFHDQTFSLHLRSLGDG